MTSNLARVLLREAFDSKEVESCKDLALLLLSSLLEAEANGELCVPFQKEYAPILKLKKHPFFLQNKEFVFFQKSHSLKENLKAEILNHLLSPSGSPALSQTYIESARKELDKELKLNFTFNEKQIEAVTKSCQNSFQIITGGPGTGKTTVIFYLLAVLEKLNLLPAPENIALLAPTGRAAQRMTESIQFLFSTSFPSATYAQSLRGSTLQGLLKIHPQTGYSQFGKERKLTKTLYIVDEVSMVDLSLMELFVKSLPKEAKLILLGDRNQLPSVGKGEILRDIISLIESTQKQDHLTILKISNRQKEGSKISEIADKVIGGEIPSINEIADWNFLKNDNFSSELVWLNPKEELTPELLTNQLWELAFYPQIINILSKFSLNSIQSPAELKDFDSHLNSIRCLTLFRQGAIGTDQLNERIVQIVKNLNEKEKWAFKVQELSSFFYFEGMPLLILQNDTSRKLFNGDTGLVLKKQNPIYPDKEELRACFKIDNTLRDFALDTLPSHSPAFFLTVHKSQGSEYEQVFFFIPKQTKQGEDSNADSLGLVNRRIFYTGLTRAKKKLVLMGDKELWNLGITDKNLNRDRLTGF